MPIIKSIREFNWDLSWKGFTSMIHSIRFYFTDEKKLKKWVYLYTFMVVPLLNYVILNIQRETLISIGGDFPPMIFSSINIILMSILIAFTIFTFIISLITFKKIRPILFSSMFTQILIMFFEINIIRKITIYYPEFTKIFFLFTILCSLSLLFIIIQLLKMIYLRIRAKVILRRELTKLSV